MSENEKRNAIIGAVVLGIIVIGLALWYMATHQPPVVTPLGQNPQGTSTPGTYEKKTVTRSDRFYDAEVSYPASTPLKASLGASADARVVETLKSYVVGQIDAFVENGQFSQMTQEDIEMLGFNQGRKYELGIDYAMTESPKTVSYLFQMYQDTMGAHPNVYYRSYTFDKRTGEEVHLDDLLTGNYLDRLSETSRKQLAISIAKASGAEPDLDYVNSGTLPLSDSFQNFYIQGDTFVLVFPPYQVGPYALGTQEVRIPFGELEDILTAEYK